MEIWIDLVFWKLPILEFLVNQIFIRVRVGDIRISGLQRRFKILRNKNKTSIEDSGKFDMLFVRPFLHHQVIIYEIRK